MPKGGYDDLRDALEQVLVARPRTSARALVTLLQREGWAVDKSRVNSVLYRHSDLFQHDGAVPPRWSLAAASPEPTERTPHRVAGVLMKNWKVFDEQAVDFAGVTLLYGENSAGKSSIVQALLLMKQSWGYGHLAFEGQLGSFGWYQHVIHRHEVGRALQLGAIWSASDGGDDSWSIAFMARADGDDDAYQEEHPIQQILCSAGEEMIALLSINSLPSRHTALSDGWAALRVAGEEVEELVIDEGVLERGQLVVVGGDGDAFPDFDDVLRVVKGSDGEPTAAASETLGVIRRVLRDATPMFDSIEHIGPSRTVPVRDIHLSWARAEAEYLARLFDDSELLADVNEWLARFEIPYSLKIDRYGDDDGDEVFELDLERIGGFAESVQLRDVGFGVSQLLPIMTQLLGNREKTILIEEPEAHVHPRLQSVLGDLFMTSMQDYGNVLVIETHSEPILLRLQRRVAEGRLDHGDLAVRHVIREGASSRIEDVPVKENGQLDYQWPGGFFDDRMDDLVAILDPRPEE
jgi:predicted ATPase